MMKDIQLAYEVNKSINQDLIQLQHIVSDTSLFFEKYPSYEMTKFEYIVYNCTKYNAGQSMTIEAEFQQLQHYLKTQFILKEHKPYTLYIKNTMNTNISNVHYFQLTDNQIIIYFLKNKLNHVSIYDLTQNTWIKELSLDINEYIFNIYLLKTSKLILSSGKRFYIWDLVNDKLLKVIQIKSSRFILEIEDNLIAVDFNKLIKLYNMSSYRCTATLSGHQDKVSSIEYLSNGRLVSSSFDKIIKIWNIQTHQCITTLVVNHVGDCLRQFNDGEFVSSSYFDSFLWNLKTFKVSRITLSINNDVRLIPKDGRYYQFYNDCITVCDINTKTMIPEDVFKMMGTSLASRFVVLKDNRVLYYLENRADIYDLGLLDFVKFVSYNWYFPMKFKK